MKVSQNICWAKGEGPINPFLVTKRWKEFCSSFKSPEDQEKSGWPKNH